MELSTLADVWILVEKHLPKEYRSKFTRRQLAGLLKRAAEGQQDVAEVSTALRIVLQLEGVKSPSFRAPPLTKPNVRLKKAQRSGFIQTLEYLAEIDRVRCQAACGTPGGSLFLRCVYTRRSFIFAGSLSVRLRKNLTPHGKLRTEVPVMRSSTPLMPAHHRHSLHR